MRLAVLTPAPDTPQISAIVQEWFERLAAPLRSLGVDAEMRTWGEAGDLSAFDAVTPLMAWFYHTSLPDWLALLDRLEGEGARVINSVDALRWNTRKTYLADLEAAGAPVVPTMFVDRLTPDVIAAAHARFGEDLIAKPQVSGAAFETARLRPGSRLTGGPSGPAMLQPFMPAVTGEGELSLIYFGGRFSHALRKVPAAGDFRVQVQHGGANTAIVASADARAAAERVLAAARRPLTYARVDLIRAADGQLRLMELEAIEPDLFLDLSPDCGAAFAQAMVRAMD